jgi:ATP/maltotriose-dependent transcriptional regulator MalT
MIGGRIELLAGDAAAAESELRSGLTALEAMGEQNLLSTVAGLLARVVYAEGRYDEAERLAELGERSAAADDVISQVLWRSARATVLAQRGEVEDAELMAREAVKLMEETDQLDSRGDALLDLAEVLRLAGGEEEAAAVVAEARQLYKRKGNVVAAERPPM